MRVWTYNEETGLLINPTGRTLRRDPLNGGYLAMRENETDKEPPITGDNETAKWSDGSWTIVADFRGTTWWDKTTRVVHQITDVEVEPEQGWTDKEPPAESYYEFSDTGNEWILSIPLLRNFQKQQIHYACEYEMKDRNQGVVSSILGVRVDCRETDVIRIGNLIETEVSEGSIEEDIISYICHDNSIVPATLAQIRLVKNELFRELQNMLMQKHTLYGQIDIAETKEEIEAIIWSW